MFVDICLTSPSSVRVSMPEQELCSAALGALCMQEGSSVGLLRVRQALKWSSHEALLNGD